MQLLSVFIAFTIRYKIVYIKTNHTAVMSKNTLKRAKKLANTSNKRPQPSQT